MVSWLGSFLAGVPLTTNPGDSGHNRPAERMRSTPEIAYGA